MSESPVPTAETEAPEGFSAGEKIPEIIPADRLEAHAEAHADDPETFGEALRATEAPAMTEAVERVLGSATAEDTGPSPMLAVRAGVPVEKAPLAVPHIRLRVSGSYATEAEADAAIENVEGSFKKKVRNQWNVYVNG